MISVLTGLIKWIFKAGWRLALVGFMLLLIINIYVVNRYNHKIGDEALEGLEGADCIMILGAGVWDSGPSYMLQDRLNKGLQLYNNNVSNRLLMSGDHGRVHYDEVNVMKDFAVTEGISPEHVFMDHAGFSTYESMVRAQKVFDVQSLVIVTQEYHLYRAVYIANQLGMDAYGVPARTITYKYQWMRNLREQVARAKDMVWLMFRVPPKYLGEVIPISGSGAATDDRDQ